MCVFLKVFPFLENHLMGCHGNHASSYNQNDFKDTSLYLYLSGPIEQISIHKILSEVFNVGLITSCDTSLFNGLILNFPSTH